MINNYDKTFNKNMYTLNSENILQNILCDLHDISFLHLFVSISAKYFLLKALKAMEVLSDEKMRGPRKM